MKLMIQDDTLYALSDGRDDDRFLSLHMKKTRRDGRTVYTAPASYTLLKQLKAAYPGLPASIENAYQILAARQAKVNRLRMSAESGDTVAFPVKVDLFSHQRKGALMACTAFGWLDNEEVVQR